MKLIQKFQHGTGVYPTSNYEVRNHNGNRKIVNKNTNEVVANAGDYVMPSALVSMYSAKDRNGQPIRDIQGKLITGFTQEEAQKNYNDRLLSDKNLRYKYQTPSNGIGTSDIETLNTLTGGAMNLISPSQWIGFGEELLNSNKSFGKAVSNMITGNSGIVSDNFARNHPYWSTGINLVTDILSPNINKFNPKRYFFTQTPNSFTRGIGSEKGLKDLVESGKIRGSKGTQVSAHNYVKEMKHKQWQELENKYPGISNRWYRRELSEEDFNIIKNTFTPDNKSTTKSFLLTKSKPLEDYENYEEYLNSLNQNGGTVTYDENWIKDPMAYFYDNGINPITNGHGYAKSNYGVKIENASSYHPYIHPSHLHYTTKGPVYLADPNVSVYQRGPFNTTLKLDKDNMIPLLYQKPNLLNGYNIFQLYRNSQNKKESN